VDFLFVLSAESNSLLLHLYQMKTSFLYGWFSYLNLSSDSRSVLIFWLFLFLSILSFLTVLKQLYDRKTFFDYIQRIFLPYWERELTSLKEKNVLLERKLKRLSRRLDQLQPTPSFDVPTDFTAQFVTLLSSRDQYTADEMSRILKNAMLMGEGSVPSYVLGVAKPLIEAGCYKADEVIELIRTANPELVAYQPTTYSDYM
jgi:hypothetical protein